MINVIIRTALVAILTATSLKANPIPVTIKEVNGQYVLLRDNEPFFIQGVGGDVALDTLVTAGGNSIRTWGNVTRKLLDKAHEKGLTVCVGLWVEHERHGFDYGNAKAVKKQIERHKRKVDELKGHPAILMWGVGNEVELHAEDVRVWDTVEAIASYIKEVAPHHPVMTATAHLLPEVVKDIRKRAPSIDILGVNSYAGIPVIPEAVRKYWKGPYIMSEWGNDGGWEADKTEWDAELEPTSAEKAQIRATRYAIFANDRKYCLGGYAFLWGDKQEVTSTWFGMLHKEKYLTESVGILAKIWGGDLGDISFPSIGYLRMNGQLPEENVTVNSDFLTTFTYELAVPKEDLAKIRWELREEQTIRKAGGDEEAVPDKIKTKFKTINPGKISFQSPKKSGPYRLFAYAYGSDGKTVSLANFPFFVK